MSVAAGSSGGYQHVFDSKRTCFSYRRSLCMWYQLTEKRIPGLIAIATGMTSCAFFVWGLGLL
jgi:hypothetical protein